MITDVLFWINYENKETIILKKEIIEEKNDKHKVMAKSQSDFQRSHL